MNPKNPTIEIDGFVLEQTCGACPEQYDVWKNGVMVGYMRLRWGHFAVSLGDCGGPIVYRASIGDGWTGCFMNSNQREQELKMAVHEIKLAIFQRDLRALDMLTGDWPF